MSVNNLLDRAGHRNVEGEDSRTLPLLLTTTQASRELGLTSQTLRNMIRRGDISARRFGRKILIPRRSVEAFIDGLPDASPPEKKQ